MTKPKSLTVYLLTGPYTWQSTDIALELAERALMKGYSVNLFLYIDGVHIPKKNQRSLRFPNAEERLKKLITLGLKVKACVRCASARGYVDGPEDMETGIFPTSQYVAGATITEIFEFPRWVKESDKVVAFGG